MPCFQDLATLTQNSPKSQHWVAFAGAIDKPGKPCRSDLGHRLRCRRLWCVYWHLRFSNRLSLLECFRKVAGLHRKEALSGSAKHSAYCRRLFSLDLARLATLTPICSERVGLFTVNDGVDSGNLVLSLDSETDGFLNDETNCKS